MKSHTEEDDLSRQIDEIEALSAIYGEDLIVENVVERNYAIKLKSESHSVEVLLQVKLPENYPSCAPPTYQLSAPWLRGQVRIDLQNTLDMIYLDNIGETVLFSWTEKIRDFLHDFDKSEAKSLPVPFTVEGIGVKCESDLDLQIEITHSDTITDRKSTFQGHCAKVTDITEVEYILRKLKNNKKIAGATHNIMAYRIKCPKKKCILKDYDDDGETHAGSRVLHLLEISEIENVVVIITRWYGGIHLGPDRFKHINNAARNALQIMGVIKTKNTSQKGHNKS